MMLVGNESVSGQQRPRSDCADELELHCLHMLRRKNILLGISPLKNTFPSKDNHNESSALCLESLLSSR